MNELLELLHKKTEALKLGGGIEKIKKHCWLLIFNI